MKKQFTYLIHSLILPAFFFSLANAQNPIELVHLGTYHSHIFDGGAAEIPAYEPSSHRVYVVNASDARIDVIDINNPSLPVLVDSIDVTSYGASANSIAIHNGILAVAVENANKQANGKVVFFDTAGVYLHDVTVGALPDMVIFSPDGNFVLCANEGEPSDDYLTDPEGTVSIIDISNGVVSATVATAGFTAFNTTPPADASIRIYGNNGSATFAEDVEPEYIAISADSKTAFVTLQENNAIAVIDIEAATVTDIYGCGFKDHAVTGNGLDASDRDDTINIVTWPVWGMYQPDAIAAYEVNGTTYLVTANEGDARDYSAYAEEERVKDLTLDTVAFPGYLALMEDEAIGRLTVTTANGDTDNDGEFEELYVLGGRSFSIFDENGNLVFDSGDDFEQIIAQELPDYFSSTNDDNDSFDNRSDNKGPEPEGVALGVINNHTFAFIGLERIGGIMVYEITDPATPVFVQYINNRDFTEDAETPEAGDLGPEGLVFIPAAVSSNGKNMLVTGNEISGTTSVFEINVDPTLNIREYDRSNSLIVYPNPANGGPVYFNQTVSGQLFDLTGRVVLEVSEQKSFDASQLEAGSYFFKSNKGEQLKVVIR